MRSIIFYPFIFLSFAMHAQDFKKFHFEEVHMGTLFQLVIYHDSDSLVQLASQKAFQRIAELDSICSDYKLDSELNSISEFAYISPMTLSEDLNFLLVESTKLYQQSGGLFSIASGPLTKLWRRGIRRKEVPQAAIINQLLLHSQTSDVKLDNETVQLLTENMRLDLGGIAKGYAVDEAFKVLKSCGIIHAIVDGGGDIYVGKSLTGKKWKIAVADEIVEVGDYKAIATSGSTFKYLTSGAKMYSHIIDPRTGWAISNPSEVTVVTDKCYIADALATIFSVDKQKDMSHVYTYELMIQQTEKIKQ